MEKPRKVEIAVISAEHLKFLDARFSKHNTFVIVRMDSLNFGTTKLDTNGGSFPSWNETLELASGPTARSLRVEVYCKTASGGKMVGEAEVPVSDFAGDLTPAGYLHFLSYRLRDKKGGKNGIINLSVRMHGWSGLPCRKEVPELVCRSSLGKIPAEFEGGCSVAGKEWSGFAIGLPVSHAYPF